MKISQHLAACANHHVAMGKIHKTAAAECDGTQKSFHESAQAAHTDAASHCLKMLEEVDLGGGGDVETGDLHGPTDKAAIGSLAERAASFDKIADSGARAILPDSGLQLVNRAGGAPLDVSQVPEEFKHLCEE